MEPTAQAKQLEKIFELNPHWQNGKIDSLLAKHPRRKYFTKFFALAKQLGIARAVILMGPRRVGKTVMLWHCIEELIQTESINPHQIVYLPVDLLTIYGHQTLEDFFKIFLHLTRQKITEKNYVIFDEIQALPQWEVQLKNLVDQYPNTKWIASGSAASTLNKQVKESGAGRFTDFLLPPLTFYEYLEFLNRTEKLLVFDEKKTKAIAAKNIDALNAEFLNYLNYGGFPEPVFNQHIRENPTRYIREDIIDKVLLKDLPILYGISNVRELDRFFRALIYQTGNEISYQKLCSSTGLHRATIEKYLDYLTDAFLIRILPRIDEDGKHFTKRNFFKFYIANPSMYAAVWGLLRPENTDELGHLVETAIISQWQNNKNFMHDLYYARFSRGDGEVDIVQKDPRDGINWCLEVKWSDRFITNPDELKSLIRFAEKHRPKTIDVTSCTKSASSIKLTPNLEASFTPAAIFCFNIGYRYFL